MGQQVDQETKTWMMLSHLSGLVGFIGPLIVWLVKKDENPAIEREAKESLNFQITMAIGFVLASVLTLVVIGVFLFPIVAIVDLIFIVIGAMAANKGEPYRYPFALRLVN